MICVHIITVLPNLEVRLGIFRTNVGSEWDPVYLSTMHLIECVGAGTKQCVGSTVIVILKQTCGQRPSRAAGSKRQALA